MAEISKDAEVPAELKSRLRAFDHALNDVEAKFTTLLNIPQNELAEKLPTLDKAKLDLVAAYSINSLFWMYLNVCGVNPKDHSIKQELDRIRGYMNRVKEIQDKSKAPSLNVQASKRFIKSALWQAAHKTADSTADPSSSEINQETEEVDEEKPKKRKKSKAGDQEKEKGKKRWKGRYMTDKT